MYEEIIQKNLELGVVGAAISYACQAERYDLLGPMEEQQGNLLQAADYYMKAGMETEQKRVVDLVMEDALKDADFYQAQHAAYLQGRNDLREKFAFLTQLTNNI